VKTQSAIDNFIHNRRAVKNLSPKTIKWYGEQLNFFARRYPKLPTEPEPIEAYLGSIQGAAETRHAAYRCLRALYRFTCKRHRLPNPMEYIDAPRCPHKLMPTLEVKELMELLSLANNLRDKAILSVFIDNGARVGELAGLRKGDIKEDRIQVNGKSGQREIPISDDTRRLLLTLLAQDTRTDYVFLNGRGQPLTRYGFYFIVRRHMRRAGIQGPKLGPHRIRHGFGKGYLVSGGDLRSLQEIMGHASITTTQKYTSLAMRDVIAKHRQFSPLKAARAAAQLSFDYLPPPITAHCSPAVEYKEVKYSATHRCLLPNIT